MYTECKKCGARILVVGKTEDFALLKDPQWVTGFPCISQKCDGVAVRTKPVSVHKELPVRAYYRAVFGLGAGDTAPADPQRVRELLLGESVAFVELEAIGQPERTLVHSITFANGAILHLAASNESACVYLVEEAQHEDRRLVADSGSQLSAENRTQSRSDPVEDEGGHRERGVSSADEHSGTGPGDGESCAVHRSTVGELRHTSHDSPSNRPTPEQ